MKRIAVAAIGMTAAMWVWPTPHAAAQSPRAQLAQAVPPNERPPRRVYRASPRLRITPDYQPEGVVPYNNPGPNAVRVCSATYVQEFRPSGTVIVPRMSCHWTRG